MNLLGKNIQEKILHWDNETIRYFLIMKSAGFKEAIYIVRWLHRLDRKWDYKIKDKLIKAEFLGNDNLNHDVNIITDFFSVRRHFVERFLIGKDDLDVDILKIYSLPFYASPITDSGYYIKVSPLTSKEKVDETYEYIKSELRKIEEQNQSGGNLAIRDRATKQKQIIRNVKIYLAVESQISQAYKIEKEPEYESKEKMILNDIYREAARMINFRPGKQEYSEEDVERIKHIYLIDVLQYFALSSFEEYKKLFVNLHLLKPSKR